MVGGNDLLDHLADRLDFAAAGRGVFRLEPVPAEVRVVGALLLGEEEGEAVALGEGGPAGAVVVGGGVLGAAVEDRDERGALGETGGDVGEHAEFAGVAGGEGDELEAEGLGEVGHGLVAFLLEAGEAGDVVAEDAVAKSGHGGRLWCREDHAATQHEGNRSDWMARTGCSGRLLGAMPTSAMIGVGR